MKTSTVSNVSECLVSKYDWQVDKGYLLYYLNGYPNISGRNTYGSYVKTLNTSVSISDGNWHHVLGVIAGNTWEIWVDGVLASSVTSFASSPSLTNNYPTTIGSYYDGTYKLLFDGALDEVRIYSRELKGSEIAYLSNQQNNFVTVNNTVCDSYTSPNGNNVFTASGVYADIKYGSSVADSVSVLNLQVNSIDTSVVLVSNQLHAYSNSNYTYQWFECSNGMVPVIGAQDSIFTPTVNGAYSVVINNGNCVDSSSCLPVTLTIPNLNTGLVAYFKLDSNVADSSTSVMHCVGSNLVNASGIRCDSNTAYSFNGNSSKVVCGASDRGVTNTVSISVWVKTTTVSSVNTFIVEKYDWQVDKGYYLALKNGIPYIAARNTSNNTGAFTWNANQTFLVTDGQWHHLLGVVSQNNLEIWVDGVLKATSSLVANTPDLTNNYNLNIGYYYKGSLSGNTNYYTGTLDEVRLYNRDLTSIEIDALSTERNTYTSNSITVCDSMVSPSGESWYASGVYQDTVSNLCLGDSIYNINLTVLSHDSSQLNEVTCGTYTSPSGNYLWGTTGTYFDTLTNALGCDSIIEINLTVTPIPITSLVASSCYSYSAPSGNRTWYSTGIYNDTLVSSAGCDSVLSISVTILPYQLVSLSETACNSYTSPSGNSVWTTSGTYLDLVSQTNGCDTLYSITLTMLQYSFHSITGTYCNSYTSPSGNYVWTNSGVYMDTVTNAAGCDSIITINLTINNSQAVTQSEQSCGNYVWPVNGTTYSASGVYSDTLTTVLGCDSVVNLNLTINSSNTSSHNITACDSLNSPSGNYVWTSSGTYIDTIPTVSGCDSIITTVLTIHNNTSSVQSATACGSYTWSANNQSYFSSGTYLDTVNNALGCDSVISLLLTINSNSATSVTVTACDAFTWATSGVGYNTSGVYPVTLTNVIGCDSIVTLNLTINNSNGSLETISACGSYYWVANGVSYTNSGTYMVSLQNLAGCDSIATLDLTINTSSSSSQTVSVCDSLNSPSGNFVWNTSGTYTDTLVNSVGCDSIITTNLTVNYSSVLNDTVVSCNSYLWLKNNVTYVSSGVYSVTVTNGTGCDSISNLLLTINNSDSITETETSCDSFSWVANGMVYTNSGIYSHTLTNASGCDSLVTLNLTILNSTLANETVLSCGDYTWGLNGITYQLSGTYIDTTVSSLGCDSIVTLNLTVNTASSNSLNESSCGVYTAPDGSFYSTSGQYIAVIPNSVGCDSTITINLSVTNIDTSVSVNGFILESNATGVFTYQWLDCINGNSPIVGATNQIYTPIVSGEYMVEISDGICLERSACINVTGVGVEEFYLEGISIYPNPAHSQLKVSNKLGLSLEISIMDITGKTIIIKETQEGLNNIDVTHLPSGFYLVKVKFENQVLIEKISIR